MYQKRRKNPTYMHLFGTIRLLIFSKKSHLYVYSVLYSYYFLGNFPTYIFIQTRRLFGTLEQFLYRLTCKGYDYFFRQPGLKSHFRELTMTSLFLWLLLAYFQQLQFQLDAHCLLDPPNSIVQHKYVIPPQRPVETFKGAPI